MEPEPQTGQEEKGPGQNLGAAASTSQAGAGRGRWSVDLVQVFVFAPHTGAQVGGQSQGARELRVVGRTTQNALAKSLRGFAKVLVAAPVQGGDRLQARREWPVIGRGARLCARPRGDHWGGTDGR